MPAGAPEPELERGALLVSGSDFMLFCIVESVGSGKRWDAGVSLGTASPGRLVPCAPVLTFDARIFRSGATVHCQQGMPPFFGRPPWLMRTDKRSRAASLQDALHEAVVVAGTENLEAALLKMSRKVRPDEGQDVAMQRVYPEHHHASAKGYGRDFKSLAVDCVRLERVRRGISGPRVEAMRRLLKLGMTELQ